MIFSYGTSLQGEDHQQWGIPCQDAHCIKTLPNGWVIAAVADGVGSAVHSERGSKLAVDTVVKFCIDNMPFTNGVVSAENDLIPLLRVAYNKAFKNIWELSISEENSFEDYDTTLDTVIYNGNSIIYGHCSDGGIIALNDTGYYDCVTDRMKGNDGESMIPLRSRKDWQFGIYPNASSAILLFTDGTYDFARQDFLEKNWTTPLYIPLLKKLSNTNYLPSNPEVWTDYFEHFMEEDFWNNYVTDDKTIVTLINLEKQTTQVENSYYEEPNWEELLQRVNNRLYGYTEIDSPVENLLDKIDSSNDTNGVNSNDIPDLSENKKKDYEDNYKKKAIAVANKNKPENSFNNQSDSSRINSPNTITDDGEQTAIYNKKVGHPIKRTILESLADLFQGE